TVVPAPMTTSSVGPGTPVSHVAGLFHRPVATLVTVAATTAGAFAASANMVASAITTVSRLRRGIVFIALLRVVRESEIIYGVARGASGSRPSRPGTRDTSWPLASL